MLGPRAEDIFCCPHKISKDANHFGVLFEVNSVPYQLGRKGVQPFTKYNPDCCVMIETIECEEHGNVYTRYNAAEKVKNPKTAMRPGPVQQVVGPPPDVKRKKPASKAVNLAGSVDDNSTHKAADQDDDDGDGVGNDLFVDDTDIHQNKKQKRTTIQEKRAQIKTRIARNTGAGTAQGSDAMDVDTEPSDAVDGLTESLKAQSISAGAVRQESGGTKKVSAEAVSVSQKIGSRVKKQNTTPKKQVGKEVPAKIPCTKVVRGKKNNDALPNAKVASNNVMNADKDATNDSEDDSATEEPEAKKLKPRLEKVPLTDPRHTFADQPMPAFPYAQPNIRTELKEVKQGNETFFSTGKRSGGKLIKAQSWDDYERRAVFNGTLYLACSDQQGNTVYKEYQKTNKFVAGAAWHSWYNFRRDERGQILKSCDACKERKNHRSIHKNLE